MLSNSIKQILKDSLLEQKEAEILLSFLIKKPREFIISHPEHELDKKTINKLKKLEQKRLNNFPIAYLTNSKGFYGLDFFVNNNVLVPRPETEILVDYLIDKIKKEKDRNTLFLDIGTGSGAIVISVAKNTENKNISFWSIDISKKALAVAKKNAKKYNLDKKIKFIKNNLLHNLENKISKFDKIIIAANLPYLNPKEMKESSIKHEPKLALKAGKDGLKYYRKLFKEIKKIDKNISIICEINPEQENGLINTINSNVKQAKYKTIKDLSQNIRFIAIN